MPEYFDREFELLPREHLEDLRNLQNQGCVYTQLYREEIEDFGMCRIQFKPQEIVQYVDSLWGYEEFLEYRDRGLSKDDAVEQVSNSKVRSTAKSYAEWVRSMEDAVQDPYCPAAFFLGELESLLCGGKPERYEFLQEKYTGDRRFLLSEIFEGLSESARVLQDRDNGRPDFEITCEKDVQDLLYAILKPIFPDARPEEYTPKHGGNSKRIDFVIPEISTVIETKYVRDGTHAGTVPDELKTDIESYHKHTDCQTMYGIVWDDEGEIVDRSNFEKDLTGPRTIDGSQFKVEVRVIP